MLSFTSFLRFVAARQQQGIVAAFGQQLAPDQTATYNGYDYRPEIYYSQ